MQVGSIVETVGDFETLRVCWGHPYPKKGEILTVSLIEEHPNPHSNKLGIVLLSFEELPELVGICDKTINGDVNFIELLPPIDTSIFEELFLEPLTV